MKKIVLVIALCASLPGLVFAQQRPGSLRGQVLDELGGAIIGASVTVIVAVLSIAGHSSPGPSLAKSRWSTSTTTSWSVS